MSRPEIERKKMGPIYYKFGIVADPGPDIILGKEQLARPKIQILDHVY